jgi:SAM-dependent methyltransferase
MITHPVSPLGRLHGSFVARRRATILAGHLAAVLPINADVLDVGCGDGTLAAEVSKRRPDLTITGLEILPRSLSHIPVRQFNGRELPCEDHSVDVVMMIDVLHHTSDPLVLLAEARRVARSAIVIKDHNRDGLLAAPTLKLMDWVGNAHHGVALPYNYWTSRQWQRAMDDLGLQATFWRRDLSLYPWPFRWIFDRSLHFLAVLSGR